jgi:glycine cleavage system H protein
VRVRSLNRGTHGLSEYLLMVFDKFELRVHKEYHYTEDGLWAKIEDGKVRIGVSDYLQRTGGDVAFVELAGQGLTVERQKEFGTLETAKTTVSLLSPISGKIDQVNGILSEKPELVNAEPYGEGWLVILAPRNLEDDLKTLMSADEYFELMQKKLETEQTKLEVR